MKLSPKKVVCVFAHPDDEAFGPAGTIAYLSKKSEVHLVCVTCGDSEKRFSLSGLDGEKLRGIRENELKESASILGVKSITLLGFKDGALCNNNYHSVAEKIKLVLDDIKPDTLLTFNTDGVSGHLDHIAVAMEVTYLFEKLKYVKNLIYFVQDAETKKIIKSKYFVYFPQGFKRNDVDWVHDVSEFYKTKISAMKAHKSQLKDYILFKSLFGKLMKTEMFKIVAK
jgi:LmbE family N-acetylglucosaminyl deacetylase